MTRTTLDTCHVVIVCHVFYNHFRLSFFFFLHVCAMHLCLFQLHMSCIFCFFTCMYKVSLFLYMFVQCFLLSFQLRMPTFCQISSNKLPYWHWCYWRNLVKKRKEKLSQSSLLNKNMYQSSVIHLHHFFFIYIFQGLSNSKCAMKCRLYKDRDLRCARIA